MPLNEASLKLECYSATLNKDTVLQEEDDENIYEAALALSKANVGLVPLTLLAPVQVVSLLQMLYRRGNAADIQELVRVLKPIGIQSDHSAFDLHYPRLCPLTKMLGHDVICVSFKNWFVLDFLATKVRQSSSETHVSELRDVAVHMLDLQDDTETPEECIIDLLVSTRTMLDTLRFLGRQRSATSCSWSASPATWNRFRTHLRSHTGTQW